MTVTQLYRLLGAMVAEGHGRRLVHIDKATFRHNCESDGVTILRVESLEERWVPLSDDDGGVATTSKGHERGSSCVVLYGDAHTPLTKRNADIYRSSADGFCANCGCEVTSHEPITGRCGRGLPSTVECKHE
jgi:hypothetical protein